MLRRARAVTPVTPLEWPSFQLLTMISRRTVVGPVRPMNLGSVTYIQSHIFAMARFSSVLSLGMAVGGDEETEVSISLHWSRTQREKDTEVSAHTHTGTRSMKKKQIKHAQKINHGDWAGATDFHDDESRNRRAELPVFQKRRNVLVTTTLLRRTATTDSMHARTGLAIASHTARLLRCC